MLILMSELLYFSLLMSINLNFLEYMCYLNFQVKKINSWLKVWQGVVVAKYLSLGVPSWFSRFDQYLGWAWVRVILSIGKCSTTAHVHPIACRKYYPTSCFHPSHRHIPKMKKISWWISQWDIFMVDCTRDSMRCFC